MNPIGIFDSGYGGLTVIRELVRELPDYDYLYLGDNARSPYGSRSYETVYRYTLECVRKLFLLDCPLVILACNTASAKALRTIQQRDLPGLDPRRRVLGVIRPTTEIIGNLSRSGKVGLFATPGTVASGSYMMEIKRFFPGLELFQEACPLWVPLVENHEPEGKGTEYFVSRHVHHLMEQCPLIDTIILACTHYPLLESSIRKFLDPEVQLLSQGPLVAQSLKEYLLRHPEMDSRLSRGGSRHFYTTDDPESFDKLAGIFYASKVDSRHLDPG